MAKNSETSQLHDSVAERAGGKISCPICGDRNGVGVGRQRRDWLVVSSQAHRQQSQKANADESEARDDDYEIGACDRRLLRSLRVHPVTRRQRQQSHLTLRLRLFRRGVPGRLV